LETFLIKIFQAIFKCSKFGYNFTICHKH
jgi:hypothetical protein